MRIAIFFMVRFPRCPDKVIDMTWVPIKFGLFKKFKQPQTGNLRIYSLCNAKIILR